MDEQEKTEGKAARQARIDTARDGLRSALVQAAKAEKRAHDEASAAEAEGRGTEAGHSAPSGQ